jgi:hypothetical protein
MSKKSLIKAALLEKMPAGALRQLETEGDEDRLWDGIAEALVPGYDAMDELSRTRNPDTTADFETLEREYGFLATDKLTEQERRARIKALKYAKAGSGTAESMEDALELAGFNLVVREGRKTLDPAVIRPTESEYIVNGFEYIREQGFDIGCNYTPGSPPSFNYGCNATGSDFDFGCKPLKVVEKFVDYEATDNWNLVFYVAEAITVDGTGLITGITPAIIPRYYRPFIREIILRLKPLHTWGVLAVDWDDPPLYGFGFFPMGITPHGL